MRAGLLILAAGLASTLCACDAVTVRETPTAPAQAAQPGASVRALVTPEGLESMWRELAGDGLELDAAPGSLDSITDAEIGPLSQRLGFTNLRAYTRAESVTMTFEFDAPQFFVPVRIGHGADTVICRWLVSAKSILAASDVRVEEGEDGLALVPVGEPLSQIENIRVDAVGECPVEFGTSSAGRTGAVGDRALFTSEVELYVKQAIADAVADLLRQSPADFYGLVRGELELTNAATFPNRVGQVTISGASRGQDALSLSTRGLSIAFDYSLQTRAAKCTPSLEFDPLLDVEPASIDPASLMLRDADIGVAMSASFMTRIAQVITRAGFACSGLETLGFDAQTIPTSELLLADVGVDESLFADTSRVTLSPGALPVISTRASDGVLEIDWPSMRFEAYTDVFGATTRALVLELDVKLSARVDPASAGSFRLSFEAISVGDVSIESGWGSEPPDPATVDTWARRFVLLSLGDSVDLPLPLSPGAPLELVGALIRDDDAVLLLRHAGD